jgi:hypothetical protein
VLIPLQSAEAELLELDKRECNYARGKVDSAGIIPLDSIGIPPNAIVWVYETHTSLATNYSTISHQDKCTTHKPSRNCPIPLSYIDVIVSGCLSFGRDFAREFLLSTKGWCPKSVLNDRNDALGRKYVGNYTEKDTLIVDELLLDVLPLEFKHIARI